MQASKRRCRLLDYLSLAPSNERVIVLIGLCRDVSVFFLKPRKDSISPVTFSSTNAVSSTVAEDIFFLYAMSGCDTSALLMQGKMKFLKTLLKNSHLADVVKVFNDSNATQERIAAAEERFRVSL